MTPALPAGLNIAVAANTLDCSITGTPTETSPQTAYTITATNASGSDTGSVNITLNPAGGPTPILANGSDVITLANMAISPITLTNTGGSADSCSVTPSLPAGLSVAVAGNGFDCEITGTPTAVTRLTKYTVTATNGSGNDTATVKITITLEQILNDTGLTWGGDYSFGNNTTCVGETISAQDCSHGRDERDEAGMLTKTGAGEGGFDFTKLDSAGADLPSGATSWSCVRDNYTHLVWEVKTNTSGTTHSQYNLYRWGGITAEGKNHANKKGLYYSDWDSLVNDSNAANFCGFDDWRVSSRESLVSIINYGRHNPSIDTTYFPYTGNNAFWTSTPNELSATQAWRVQFSTGSSNKHNRISNARVRLVRGAATP